MKGIVQVPSLSLTTNRGETTMQHFVKQRATETGDIEFYTPAIDVVGVPQLTFELITYRLQGTTPQIVAQLQTSSDLETFGNVSGADVTLATTDTDIDQANAKDRPYSRYVRFKITISGSVTEIEYSLVLNTYPSS